MWDTLRKRLINWEAIYCYYVFGYNKAIWYQVYSPVTGNYYFFHSTTEYWLDSVSLDMRTLFWKENLWIRYHINTEPFITLTEIPRIINPKLQFLEKILMYK